MKPEVVIIAAVANHGAIGRGGDLLYHISADLKRFKELTMGYPVIMGRKTFESLPKGALPGRRNIVITRNPDFSAPDTETAASLEAAVRNIGGNTEVCFVIGGGQIYNEAIKRADRLELTVIDADCPDADTFFPRFDAGEWPVTCESERFTDPKSGVGYRFVTRRRAGRSLL